MTELELAMMDWLGDALGLPKEFHNRGGGSGIGIIQSTASDSTFMAILAARAQIIEVYLRNSKIDQILYIYTFVLGIYPTLLPDLPFFVKRVGNFDCCSQPTCRLA